jgi:hypothetical protein
MSNPVSTRVLLVFAGAVLAMSVSSAAAAPRGSQSFVTAQKLDYDRPRLRVPSRVVGDRRPGSDRPRPGRGTGTPDTSRDDPPKSSTPGRRPDGDKPPTRTVCAGGRFVAGSCTCPPGTRARATGPARLTCMPVVVVVPPVPPAEPPRFVAPLPPPGPPRRPPVASRPIPVAPPATVAALGGEVLPREVIVTLASNAPADAEEQIARRHGMAIVERTSLPLLGVRAMRCRWTSGRTVPALIQAIQSDPDATGVQANYIYRPSQSAAPAAATASLQYALAKLELPEAHTLSTGRGARIAIIDSGVDTRHPDFDGATLERFDALGGARAEPGSHGTAIAGIIAARGTVRGIAPSATVMSVRAFPSDRSTEPQMTTTFVLLKSMEWSVANGARVLNLSLAGPRDPLVERAVSAAAGRGVILVAAAGNNGDRAPPAYPAAYPDVIAVTAIDARDQIYEKANRGGYIAVAAPGVDVLAPVRDDGHDLQSGTSFAAAHVSGILALLLERRPGLTTDEARRVLAESAADLGLPGRDDHFGAGRTNAAAALKRLEN